MRQGVPKLLFRVAQEDDMLGDMRLDCVMLYQSSIMYGTEG
jgi:hypothetical protein